MCTYFPYYAILAQCFLGHEQGDGRPLSCVLGDEQGDGRPLSCGFVNKLIILYKKKINLFSAFLL